MSETAKPQFKPLVLVVDDEMPMRKYLENLLKIHGYDVVAVASVKDAVLSLQEKSVDLVITDMVMPNMDGLELIEEIKTARHLCKVIVLSGLTTPKTRETLIDRGVSACLAKPVKQQDLLAAIHSALNI